MTLKNIPISLLDASEFESREKVNPLVTTGSLGIIVPPLVRPKEGGRYEVVAGHRRLESARQMGLKTMVCSVKQVDDKNAALLHFGENEDRASLSPVERGRFFGTFLKKFRLSEREAGEALGVSHTQISQSVGLAKISGEVVGRLTSDEAAWVGDVLTTTKFSAVGRLPQPQKVSVLTEVVRNKLSDREMKRVVDQVQLGSEVQDAVRVILGARGGKKLVQFVTQTDRPARVVCPRCHTPLWVEHLPSGEHKILNSPPGKSS